MIPHDLTSMVGRSESIDGLPCAGPAQHVAGPEALKGGPLLTRLIEDEAAFETLERPWSTLAATCGAGPFQEFGWAKAWIQTIGRCEGRKLRIVTVWQGGRLVAILPFLRRRYFGMRLLEWIAARVTDYCDALVHPDVDAKRVLHLLWEALTASRDCDIVRLGQMRDDAKLHELFAVDELRPWVETHEQTYSLPIHWTDAEQWLKSQGTHARKQTRYDLRHLAKAGFEYYVWKSPDPYEPLLEALIAQKSAWLARRGLGTLMGHARGPDFLRSCVAQMAAQGSLHLSAFRSNEGFAACHLGFHHRGVLYGYMPTYDPRWAGYSAGAAIRDAFIMWACDHSVQRVELLRGAHEFKLRYRPEQIGLRTFIIPIGLIGQTCLAAYRVTFGAPLRSRYAVGGYPKKY